MAKTNINVGFKTRYRLQAIERDTCKPVGEEIHVENMVLRNGLLNLGNDIAFTNIAIGTSPVPVDFEQFGLIATTAEMPVADGTFNQEIFQTDDGNVISRITREYVFKNFRFPSNVRTLTISEIGLVGVTRAVLNQPITITPNNWVRVTAEIDFTYFSSPVQFVPTSVNSQPTTEYLEYYVTPFIYNETPQNIDSKGFGTNNSVIGYVWDGVEENIGDRTYGSTLGITMSRQLDFDGKRYVFTAKGKFDDQSVIPGFVIRDVLNGGGFKITFPNELIVEEDDAIELQFTFNWDGSNGTSTPRPEEAPR